MTTHVHQFPCLNDNYGALIHDSGSGRTAAIDAPDGEAVLAAARAQGWRSPTCSSPTTTPTTRRGCRRCARLSRPARRRAGEGGGADRRLDVKLGEGDFVEIGACVARVIETPGHTAGHIVYLFEEDEIAFVGDTLFSLGCGRVLETPLPYVEFAGQTRRAAGRDAGLLRARIHRGQRALRPDHRARQRRSAGAAPPKSPPLRAAGKPTVPTTIAAELAANPFLRAELPSVQAAVGMAGADPAAVFAEIRARKDRF